MTNTRTTIRSWPAMGLAVVFLAGTSFVLFQDLLDGASRPPPPGTRSSPCSARAASASPSAW